MVSVVGPTGQGTPLACSISEQLRLNNHSFFIHPRAQELKQKLGIETYGDSTDVELELS